MNGSADQQPAADVKRVRPKESCAQVDAVGRREGEGRVKVNRISRM